MVSRFLLPKPRETGAGLLIVRGAHEETDADGD